MTTDRRKKIAYFINQYPGISHSFIRREILALERQGVSVERFAIRPSPDATVSREDGEEAAKTRHIVTSSKTSLLADMFAQFFKAPLRAVGALSAALKYGWRSEAGLLRHFFYFGEALVLARWMEKSGLDHVHAHFGTNAAMIALLASQMSGSTYSMTVHGPEEFEKPKLISLKQKVEKSAFTVAISKYGAAQLKKITEPEDWLKIKIVHCGIEKTFFEESHPHLPDENTMVCVGRLCAEKGQIDLVHAVAKIRSAIPGLKVSLIGDGPMRDHIEAAVKKNALEDCVILEGWKSPAEVREALEGARVFILPSYAEGLPVSIMEALTIKRPVISTYIAGIPELIENRVCGWLTPAGDVDAIADAISTAMTADEATLEAFAAEGFSRVRAAHDIDTEAQKLAAHFTSVTEQRQ